MDGDDEAEMFEEFVPSRESLWVTVACLGVRMSIDETGSEVDAYRFLEFCAL